jgi:hypothetical protein|tara:strand:- start:2549 stop:2656 length:108 start_codon:yes stop_codon:yes gene_type:complete
MTPEERARDAVLPGAGGMATFNRVVAQIREAEATA